MLKRLILILLLLVPVVTWAQKDYYIHKALAKETIYSISRKTGVKVKTIIEMNPGFTKTTKLALGQEVRLPMTAPMPVVKPDMVIAHKPVQDTVSIPVFQEKKARQDSNVIALLLPLYSDEIVGDTEAGNTDEKIRIPAKADQFLQFYEGALLAFDSLKRAGNTLNVHVVDMAVKSDAIPQKIREIDSIAPDLIIGPVYESQTRVVSSTLADRSVPVIYPLSSKNTSIAASSNVVQLNISNASFAERMKEWLAAKIQDTSARLMYLPMHRVSDITNKVIAKVAEIPGARKFSWPRGVVADNIAAMIGAGLSVTGENYIVCPTMDEAELSVVLPVLLLCAEKYKVTLVGLPDWQTFSVVDLENFYKLNVTFLTYSHNDISMPEMGGFYEKFKNYFSVMPSSLACKGYDTAFYFGNLLCRYGNIFNSRMLESEGSGLFSTYLFERLGGNGAYENKALFSVTYGRDFKLHIDK